MNEVSANPNIVETCTTEKYEILKTWNNSIKKCEKALNDYLESKKK